MNLKNDFDALQGALAMEGKTINDLDSLSTFLENKMGVKKEIYKGLNCDEIKIIAPDKSDEISDYSNEVWPTIALCYYENRTLCPIILSNPCPEVKTQYLVGKQILSMLVYFIALTRKQLEDSVRCRRLLMNLLDISTCQGCIAFQLFFDDYNRIWSDDPLPSYVLFFKNNEANLIDLSSLKVSEITLKEADRIYKAVDATEQLILGNMCKEKDKEIQELIDYEIMFDDYPNTKPLSKMAGRNLGF
jgi:hypothetical protein